jgi:hypothetical protein
VLAEKSIELEEGSAVFIVMDGNILRSRKMVSLSRNRQCRVEIHEIDFTADSTLKDDYQTSYTIINPSTLVL